MKYVISKQRHPLPILALFTALTLLSCAVENQNNGTLFIKMPGGTNARAVTPAFLNTLSYHINCEGSADVSRTARAGEAVSIPLAAGDWEITVTALNAAGEEIGRVETKPVTIEAGKTAAMTIPIELEKDRRNITRFEITNPVKAQGTINQENQTINVTVPAGTIMSNMSFSLVHTGREVSPSPGSPRNFNTPQTFTVTAENGETKVYTVTVTNSDTYIPVIAIVLPFGDDMTVTVAVGTPVILNATVVPANATNKTIIWTINNPRIAIINGNVLTTVSIGSAIVRAEINGGDFQDNVVAAFAIEVVDNERKILIPSEEVVYAASSDTSAKVSFTGAYGLFGLTTSDFIVSSGATISAIEVDADTCFVTITFPVNTNIETISYELGINQSSVLIRGVAFVTVYQYGIDGP